MFKNGSGIYQIKNLENGKLYIGSAVDFKRRKRQHFFNLRHNKHKNSHLQNAWNKYGEEKFVFEIIERIEDKEILTEKEDFYISLYDAANPNVGYNNRKESSTNLGLKHTEASKQKMSKSKKGKPLGKRDFPMPIEQRLQISESLLGNIPWNKGIPMREESKKKLSESNIGRPAWNKGIPQTEKAKENMSNAQKGRKCSPETRQKMSKSNKKSNLGKTLNTEDNKLWGYKKEGSSSIYIGVFYVKRNKNWMAKIPFNGKSIYIGKFKNEIDAAKAYNAKAIELYGDKARLNIIPEEKEV